MTVPQRAWLQKCLPVLLAILVIRFGFFPLHDWQEQKRADIFLLQKKLARLENLERNRVQLKTALDETESRFEEMKKRFPADASTPETLQIKTQTFLEGLATQCGLSVHGTEWLHPNEGPLMIQAPIQISFQARMDELYDFIYRIESDPQLYKVSKIELNKQKGQKLRGKIEISAFGLASTGAPGEGEKGSLKKREKAPNASSPVAGQE